MTKESFLKEYGQTMLNECAHFFEEGSLDLELYERRNGDPKFIRLGPHVWPTFFLHLCNWGCGESSYLHGKSGHVYLVAPGDGITFDGEEGFTQLYRQTNSLKEWWERWLRGENQPWNEGLKVEAIKAARQQTHYPELNNNDQMEENDDSPV